MRATQKIRNVLRGLMQRFGTENIKRRLWNREYRQGRWNCLDNMAGDCVYSHVEKHAKNGDILDLGCGPGVVGSELNVNSYHSYTGVDICDVAIEKAAKRAAETHRTDKNEYLVSDIVSYVPKQLYDVILFGDSIYYFSHQRIAEILDRYFKYLKPNGVFLVRTWVTRARVRTIVRNIERSFEVVEKRLYHSDRIVVIAFRPASQLVSTERPGDN